MKAAVYLRQSEDRDDDQLAISRQREDCHKLCEQRGWDPIDYVDNDTSAVGAKRKRPAWEQMLKDIESRAVQAVVCWDLDRLYREPIDLEYLIPLADRMGTALATVTGDVDLSTDNGRMIARIKGAVARAEIDRRSARQKRKGRQMAEAGEFWGSRRPFGYERDGTIIQLEVDALREAYELVLAGHSLSSILTAWNARGLRSSLGNTWKSPTTLRKILQNPRYAGWRSYNGEIIGKGKWEPIIAEDVWQAVNDILSDPGRKTGPSTGRKHLLVGIARCGECAREGRVSTMDVATAHKSRKATYRCRECFGVIRVADKVDDYVTDLIVARLAREDAEELLVDQNRPDLYALRQEAAALREQLNSLAVDFVEGELTKEQLRIMTSRWKAKLAAAESSMEDANRARLFRGVTGENAPKFRGFHLDRRRAIIDSLITVTIQKAKQRGVWDSETIEVKWKS